MHAASHLGRGIRFAAVGVIGLGTAGTASAALLNLTKTFPDITSSQTTTYNATTDQFTASGSALEFNAAPDMPQQIAGGSFNIVATVDQNGVLAAGGTINIGGDVDGLAGDTSPLLTGTLTDFGFQAGSSLFEFLFTVTGGSLSTLGCGAGGNDPCFPVGGTGGVILQGGPTLGSFLTNYSGTFGSSDTFFVPEPSAALLLVLGGVVVASRRLKR